MVLESQKEVMSLEKIGEGGQSIVYKIDENWVFKHYKLDSKYPIDFRAIEIMCNEVNNLKRIIVPIKIDYNITKNKILGTYSRFVSPQEIELGNILCSTLYQWYIELYEDTKVLSSKKIKMIDSVAWNYILNEEGPFLIDVDSFKFCPEKSLESVEKENIEDLNYVFLYGFVWKVGQFVAKQSFDEIFEEISNFKGTLYDFIKCKNAYDYGKSSVSGTIKR